MDLRLEKRNSLYFYSVFLVLISIMTVVLVYFWRIGFFNPNRSDQYIAEEVKLGQLIKWQQSNSSKWLNWSQNSRWELITTDADYLETKIKEINILSDASDTKLFENELNLFREKINKIQQRGSLLPVIKDALKTTEQFEKIALANNWPTLIRSSASIKRILHLNSWLQNTSDYSSRVRSMLKLMTNVVDQSVLSAENKTIVKNYITSMDAHLGQMKINSEVQKEFAPHLIKFSQVSRDFIQNGSLKIAYRKVQSHEESRYFLYSLLSLLGIMLLSFFGGIVVDLFNNKNMKAEVEGLIKKIVENKILKSESKYSMNSFSENLSLYINKTSDYIKKRMSFGNIFVQSLPFPSILLDSNLKLKWANSLFLKLWGLSEQEVYGQNVTWDYLSKSTNLSHSDPIFDALKSQVGGIFQIKIKNAQAESFPFEMYVSPVEQDQERQLMILFYPLESMQETIKDQAMSIINPINELLENLSPKKIWDDKKVAQLKEVFDVAGISFIFNRMIKIHLQNQKNIEDLREKLNQLNLSCDKFEEVFLKTSHLAQEGENLFHHNRDLMINLKDSFVSYLKSREKMNTDFTHQLNSTQELTQLMTYEEKRKQEMMQIMMEFFHHLPQLHSWREEMKSLRQDAYENRQRLGHGLSQMIHFKKKIKDAQLLEKFEEQYGKVNEDLSRQNHSYDLLEKKLQTMEVIFTKTQLIFSTLENKLEQIFQDFNQRSRDQNQKFDFKEYILRTDLMNKELVLQEDNLAELIKGIYQFNETEGQIFQSINHENEIIVSSFEETNSNDQLELKDSLQ